MRANPIKADGPARMSRAAAGNQPPRDPSETS